MFLVKDETTVNNTSLGNLQAANINDVLSKFIEIKVYLKIFFISFF